MTKGRGPGRPRKIAGGSFGGDLLSYGQRKMIRVLAEARAAKRAMHQYEAYYLAFDAAGSSRATAYVEASRIMHLPGAEGYYWFCYERAQGLAEIADGVAAMRADQENVKLLGFDSFSQFIRLAKVLTDIYTRGRD